MGFVLSLLYLVVSYLTPPAVFGSLAQYRIELVLAVLILLVSIPQLMKSFVLKTPQALALAGLSLSVFLSIFVALHWMTGAVDALLGFIPSIYAYFVLGLHCNSRKKLQSLVLMLLFVCLFVIANGVRDLRSLNALTGSQVAASSVNTEDGTWEFEHPYTFPMLNSSGEWFFRIRGLGEIHDPNDFGQLLVCEIPLLFIFWRPKKRIRNLVFVLIPACILIYGIYLTHSRGALVALAVVILVAARRRIGTIPAVVIAGALFAGAMALHFTGGRAISASAGEDRTELWGESLQLLKSHPVFGVGFGQLPDYIGHTAHNSVVVCVTELGLLGLFFWALFLFPTLRNVLLLSSPKRVEDIEEVETDEFPLLSRPWKGTALDKPEINHWGYCLLLSLVGFLATGWFLSRAFVMTLFLLGGIVEVLYETARRRGMTPPRLALQRTFVYSSWLMVGSVTAVYIMLRILNLSR